MNEIALRLHNETLHMERVSPILFMRLARMEFDECVELCKIVREWRFAEGKDQPRKKYERIK